MLVVDLNKVNFEYDVQALVRAFYPQEQGYVLTPETRADRRREMEDDARIKCVILEDGALLTLDGGLHRYRWPDKGCGGEEPSVNSHLAGQSKKKDSDPTGVPSEKEEITTTDMPGEKEEIATTDMPIEKKEIVTLDAT